MVLMVGVCKKCGQQGFIVNKTHYLCDRCNQIRLHGCSRQERYIKKRKVVKTKKPSGELALSNLKSGLAPFECMWLK